MLEQSTSGYATSHTPQHQIGLFYMYMNQILIIQVSSSGTVHTISHTSNRMQDIIFAAANRELNNYMHI